MPTYRIHRLKDHLRQQVRFAPHVSGIATVKPRDYHPLDPAAAPNEAHDEAPAGTQVEAPTPYAAFFALRDSGTPLEVGDLLEAPDGSLRIFKFVGFEEAQWVLPEVKPVSAAPPPGSALHDDQPPALQ
jgi:hypothetical protein